MKSNPLKPAVIIFTFWIATALASLAQFNTLVSFNAAHGANNPAGGLVQSTNGNLYTTTEGGQNNFGGVVETTTAGVLTMLYNFCVPNCDSGGQPQAGLVLATNGYFYGTTSIEGLNDNGTSGYGTVLKISPSGALTTLYNFCSLANCADGANPQGALVQATNGNFYGVTFRGGSGDCDCGTVFEMTPTGKLTTLHSFAGSGNPYGGLMQATNGMLYGTTVGTIFEITTAGEFTTLYTLGAADGGNIYSSLIQGTNGNLYGTASTGGSYGLGSVFEITPGGAFTVLYSFCAQGGECSDGEVPFAGLVEGSDGNLYGTTTFGGANFGCNSDNTCGTIFKITTGGALTTLYSFCSQTNCTDGYNPYGPLAQATNGTLYGTTFNGGSGPCFESCGTIFSLSVGLDPFVKTIPTSDLAGKSVKILGNNLKGSTSVTFNGTPASFKASSSYITATVPVGATIGPVQVTTASGGTLTSNVPFVLLVAPHITNFTPPSGPAGTSVQITGAGLTNTDVVTFGGVVATMFTVNSDTLVTASVPTGAKTGRIKITTPGGTATSAPSFIVTK